MKKLGEAFKTIETRANEAQETRVLSGNLARFRHVSLIRKGRGLVPVDDKTEEKQPVTSLQEWWRRGESNPRPKVFRQK
jgi:hypothetical protein